MVKKKKNQGKKIREKNGKYWLAYWVIYDGEWTSSGDGDGDRQLPSRCIYCACSCGRWNLEEEEDEEEEEEDEDEEEEEKERIWCWWVIADAFLSCRMCRRFIRPLYSDLDRLAVWLNLANSIPSQCRYTLHRSINRIDVFFPPPPHSLSLLIFLFIWCCLSLCRWACRYVAFVIARAVSEQFQSGLNFWSGQWW